MLPFVVMYMESIGRRDEGAMTASDGMQGVRQGLQQILREQHETMRSLIDGLDHDTLHWEPGEETNSLAVLYTHLLGAEEFLVGTTVGEVVARDRDAEFRSPLQDVESLLRRIDEVERRTAAWIDRLTAEHLTTIRQPAGDRLDRRHLGSWWIFHAIEHNREHIGQALLTRQLYEQKYGR